MALALAAGACGPTPAPPSPQASGLASPAATDLPTPAATLTGSMPPASTVTWTSLTVAPRPDFPVGIGQIVSWPGGELALGGSPDGSPMVAWLSRDGRHWVQLPRETFGTTNTWTAGAAGRDLVVVGMDGQSVVHAYHSTDGLTWTTSRPPVFGNNELLWLAGSERGFVGVLDGPNPATVYSRDGVTWSEVSLPVPAGHTAGVLSVAATANGFVAAGDVSRASTGGVTLAVSQPTAVLPAAWFSPDGRTWQAASVGQGVAEALTEVRAGAGGLMAVGVSGGTPAFTTYWTSTDGRAWAPSEGPLGNSPEGEGVGGINGLFYGDGTRIVVEGTRSAAGPMEWLTSPDGRHWTPLAFSGEDLSARWYDVQPLLVPDGIVFAAPSETWLGLAAP